MASPRGAPVIYVAGSARELPAEVQDWLSRADTRAFASPHLYDMLAQLARGRKFSAIIVNIQSVDWNEMEFFDHVGRLSRSTPVFVAGKHAQRGKLEAACRRGARLFDAAVLEEELAAGCGELQASGAGRAERCGSAKGEAAPEACDLADREAAAVEARPVETSPWLRVKLADLAETEEVDEASDEIEAVESGWLDDALSTAGEVAEPGAAASAGGAVTPVEAEAEVEAGDADAGATVAQVLSGEPADVAVPDGPAAEAGVAPVVSETAEADVPGDQDQPRWADVEKVPAERSEARDGQSVVRLAENGPQAPSDEVPVVFPWSSHPNRPKRTPPGLTGEQESPPAAGVPFTNPESPFRSVRLTAEEINALMGQPVRRQGPEGQA